MDLPPQVSNDGLAQFLVKSRENELKLNLESWQKFKDFVTSQLSTAVCL